MPVREKGRASVVPTALGPLGVAWTEHGLSRVLLPFVGDAPDEAMRKRLVRDGAELVDHERSPLHRAWAARLAAHLEGDDVAFDDLPIDEGGRRSKPLLADSRARVDKEPIPRSSHWTFFVARNRGGS